MGVGNQEEEMTMEKWMPDGDVCVDFKNNMFTVPIPKCASTLLRHHIFFNDKNKIINGMRVGDLEDIRTTELAVVPDGNKKILRDIDRSNIYDTSILNNMDCLLFVREPLNRFITGFSEHFYRLIANVRFKDSKDKKQAIRPHLAEIENEITTFFMNSKFEDFLVLLHSRKNKMDHHCLPVTTIVDWENLKTFSDKITFFETDINLYSNVAHWMRARETPLAIEHDTISNATIDKGLKSFIKGSLALYIKQNATEFMKEFNHFYKDDIEFYNYALPKCYRGAEQ